MAGPLKKYRFLRLPLPRALNATIFSLAAAGEIFPRSAMTLLSGSPTSLLVISAEIARVCMSVGTLMFSFDTAFFVPGDFVRVECRVGGISSLRRLVGRFKSCGKLSEIIQILNFTFHGSFSNYLEYLTR